LAILGNGTVLGKEGKQGSRAAGESAFNVARMMGHSKSPLVDKVYAHLSAQHFIRQLD
jgi:hypothetical protein